MNKFIFRLIISISFLDMHESTITSCIFAPADDKVVTTSMDRTSKFYDLRSNKVTIQLE